MFNDAIKMNKILIFWNLVGLWASIENVNIG